MNHSTLWLLFSLSTQHPAADMDTLRLRGEALLSESRIVEAEAVFAAWVEWAPSSSDAHYDLAVSRALLGRVSAAREEFIRSIELDTRRADARFEIAAGFLIEKNYAEAIVWIDEGLHRAPNDPFGLDLAGTVHFLNGGKIWALQYWNRVNRPRLRSLQIETNGHAERQVVADAVGLAPGDLLSWREIQRARWRLAQYRYLRDVVFEPVPGDTPDQYDLRVAVDGRHGIGSPAEVLLGGAADLGSSSLRLTDWNIAQTGVTVAARWRWVTDARLAQVSVDVPGILRTSVSALLSFSARDERWNSSHAGGGFRLERRDTEVSLTIPLRLPESAMVLSAILRRRRFTPFLDSDPMDNHRSLRDTSVTGAVWLRATPTTTFAERRSPTGWAFQPILRGSMEAGREWSVGWPTFSRLSLSSSFSLKKLVPSRRQQDVVVALSAGALLGPGLAEDQFILAAGPDGNVAMRAHPFLRDGRPGSAALASRFMVGNLTVGSALKSWTPFTVGVVGFADVGMLASGYPIQGNSHRLVDAGLGLEFGTFLSTLSRVTVVWGRDWRQRRNIVYVTASLR